jgi:4-hydroxy-tetrahydrodipicolinate synthase
VIVSNALRGIWSAALTPVDERYEPDAPRAVAYYRDLLGAGIDGINLLGTSGEAMSFSTAQRMRLMEAVAASLPHERIMCGTGASAVAEAAELARAAADLGFSAALVMPPFFYREATVDGVVRFFDALFARTGSLRCTVLLYNFPKMSGITFSLALVERLRAEFPGAVGGMKDSSNDRDLQRALLARYDDFRVFPGSEQDLLVAKSDGASGCISGSVCLWPRLAQDVFTTGDAALGAQLRERRLSLQDAPLIEQVRRRVARERGDDAWLRAVPPNTFI